MTSPITVTINVTQEEVKTFMKRLFLKHLKYFLYFGAALILLNTYNLWNLGTGISDVLRTVVFFVAIFLCWQLTFHFGAKNIYKNKKDDFDHSIYSFSEDKLEIQSASGEIKLNWNGIDRVEEDKDFLLLYPAMNQAYILPKRCFQDKETLEAVLQLAQRMIQHK